MKQILTYAGYKESFDIYQLKRTILNMSTNTQTYLQEITMIIIASVVVFFTSILEGCAWGVGQLRPCHVARAA